MTPALDRFLARPDPLRFSSYGLARGAAELLRADGLTAEIIHSPRHRTDANPFLVVVNHQEPAAA